MVSGFISHFISIYINIMKLLYYLLQANPKPECVYTRFDEKWKLGSG